MVLDRGATFCLTLSDLIQLVVIRSFASLTGSIEDAARDGPCAHGNVRPSIRSESRSIYNRESI